MPNRKFVVSLLLFLASCTNAEATAPSVVDTQVIPTNTVTVPTSSPTVPPRTPTIQAACDPFQADFCVTDGHFILQRPIHPPANNLVDDFYPYGSTANGTRDPHHGVEFGNPGGTPVHAAADGRVIFAGPDAEATYAPWPNFYGNLVVILHEDEVFTLYAHLSRIDVDSGQQVSAGDKIGEVGSTGVAIGSHLHFEVRWGNGEDYFATQNPELWLTPGKDADGNPLGVLMLSVRDGNRALVKHAEYTIQYHPGSDQPPAKTYYGATYPAEMLHGDENAVLSGLSAGTYRIAVDRNGRIYERWVEVEWGKLTEVIFVVE